MTAAYIIIAVLCAAMIGGIWCIVTRAGEAEGVNDYRRQDEREEDK